MVAELKKEKAGICSSWIAVAAFLVTICLSGWHAPAAAQDAEYMQGEYELQLLELAEILGALHHLRGNCLERESQTWRQEMQRLVQLEDPSDERKNEMTLRFNKGFADARRAHPKCTRAGAREGERLAREGAILARAIANNVAAW